MKRIFCALIAFVMVALMLPLTLSAASFTLKDTGFEYSGVDPVPLLVLVVSYDPDGDASWQPFFYQIRERYKCTGKQICTKWG